MYACLSNSNLKKKKWLCLAIWVTHFGCQTRDSPSTDLDASGLGLTMVSLPARCRQRRPLMTRLSPTVVALCLLAASIGYVAGGGGLHVPRTPSIVDAYATGRHSFYFSSGMTCDDHGTGLRRPAFFFFFFFFFFFLVMKAADIDHPHQPIAQTWVGWHRPRLRRTRFTSSRRFLPTNAFPAVTIRTATTTTRSSTPRLSPGSIWPCKVCSCLFRACTRAPVTCRALGEAKGGIERTLIPMSSPWPFG